ncbi:MAG: T9SS C-terminal target domain-containing protein [Flavobacteriales bacterium TMED84]|nr:MAG: T9SS C-terminal target domain-containing protein [Flavobacteriales bacterium TMED84]
MSNYKFFFQINIFFTMPGSDRLEQSTVINDLDIYTNPSRDVFNISFNTANKQDITLRIRNIVGEEIYTEQLNQFDGTYTKAIRLENYPKAVYFLEINTTEGTVNKKLVL